MQLLKVNPEKPENEVIAQAAKAIYAGQVIAAPTDTVYGLLADPFNASATKRIYELKGRAFDKPLILLVADRECLDRFAVNILPSALNAVKHFWPGALTVILQASDITPRSILSGGASVGFRQPAHPVMLRLLEAVGGVLASTSANLSGGHSSINVANIIKTFSDKLDLILDAGISPIGRESSIVDFTREPPRLLREGHITQADLKNIVGKLTFNT